MNPTAILILFFLLVSVLVSYSSALRSTTLAQYATGSRVTTTASMVASILSVTYGGFIFYQSLTLGYLFILMGASISYFLIAALIPSRLPVFLNSCSIADAMGKLHGKYVRCIVAGLAMFSTVAMAAVHVKVLGMALAELLDISQWVGIGGIMMVVVFMVQSRDMGRSPFFQIFRYITFVIFLPIMAWVLWKLFLSKYATIGQNNLALMIKSTAQIWFYRHHGPMFYLAYFFAFLFPALYPTEMRFVLAGENSIQVKRSFNYAAFFGISINLVLFWIALLLKGTSYQLKIAHVFSLFPSFWLLKVFFLLGVVTLSLSTASANLHAATVLCMHDLYRVKSPPKTTISPSLPTIFLGCIVALLACKFARSFDLFTLAILLFKPLVSVALFCTLLGWRVDRYAVMMGMFGGGVVMVIWPFFFHASQLASLMPAMCANALLLMLTQVWLNYHRCSQYNSLASSLIKGAGSVFGFSWTKLGQILIFRIKTFSLWSYCEKQFPRSNTLHILFSFYILITNYCSFYTFSTHPAWSLRLESMILLPSLCTAAFFIVYASIVPTQLFVQIAAFIWELANFYFLILVGIAMVVLSKVSNLHTIILMVNFSLSILMTSYLLLFVRLFIALVFLSIAFPLGKDLGVIDQFFHINISVTYVILMAFIFIGGVLYYKESFRKLRVKIQDLKVEQKDHKIRQSFRKQQIDALCYESNYVVGQLYGELSRFLHNQSMDSGVLVKGQFLKLKKYLFSLFTYLKHNLYLALNLVNIEELLRDCFDNIHIKTIYDYPYVMIGTDNLYIQCDEEQIRKLLINSLTACRLMRSMQANHERDIYVYIDDTNLAYRLTLLEGEMQKVAAISLVVTTDSEKPVINSVYKVTEMADFQIIHRESAQDKASFNVENHHIINAHYGYSKVMRTDQHITYMYVVPVDIQYIIKTFTDLSPVVHTQQVKLDAVGTHKEGVFLKKVEQKSWLDKGFIHGILELIKTYYATQRRKTGELSYLHPVAVASILLDITQEKDLIIAGLVHDIVQNTPLTQAGLTTIVGEVVVDLVLESRSISTQLACEKGDYLSYIQNIMSHKSSNVILLKLADVLHNTRTIHGHDYKKQIEKAKLIQKFYVPLAEQMCLPEIASELHLCVAKLLK